MRQCHLYFTSMSPQCRFTFSRLISTLWCFHTIKFTWMERAWKCRFKYVARYGVALFGGPSVRPRSYPIFFFNTVSMNSFCIDNTNISGNMLRGFRVWSENPRNPSVFGRQCKWFSVAQELGQWIVLKCRLWTQTRRFFRKCVSVPCGASVQMKKSPRRCSNPGLWTLAPRDAHWAI